MLGLSLVLIQGPGSFNSRSEVGAISVGEKVGGGGEISSAEHFSGIRSK